MRSGLPMVSRNRSRAGAGLGSTRSGWPPHAGRCELPQVGHAGLVQGETDTGCTPVGGTGWSTTTVAFDGAAGTSACPDARQRCQACSPPVE